MPLDLNGKVGIFIQDTGKFIQSSFALFINRGATQWKDKFVGKRDIDIIAFYVDIQSAILEAKEGGVQGILKFLKFGIACSKLLF